MRFRFSWRVTLIAGLLALGMLRMSYWQWERHQAKTEYIAALNHRFEEPVKPLPSLLSEKTAWESLPHRRVFIEGEYDFAHEMVLRNRRSDGVAGMHVLTPLRLAGTDKAILVSRGFVPLEKSSQEARKIFQGEARVSFIGLVKESSDERFLAPQDPETGDGKHWVDAWLRVNIPKISRQIPYPLLPVYVERMGKDEQSIQKEDLITKESGRDELFVLSSKPSLQQVKLPDWSLSYPIAAFDTVVPAGRHLGYVFEWAAMALGTIIVAVLLQFRRRRSTGTSNTVVGADTSLP